MSTTTDYKSSEHLKLIKGKEYLPAAERAILFGKNHKNGRITTEQVKNHYGFHFEHDEKTKVTTFVDDSFAITKATAFYDLGDGKCCIATGHGMESATDFPNNWEEKSETKSVARALDRIGYGTNYAQMEKQGITKFDFKTRVQTIGNGNGAFNYILVPWRLRMFMQENDEFQITTEILELDMDKPVARMVKQWNDKKKVSELVLQEGKGLVRFKATISGNNVGLREGIALARAIDFSEYIEYGETKAVGRALAAFGYSVRGAEEYDERERIADTPLVFQGADLPEQAEEQGEQRTTEQPQKPALPAGKPPKQVTSSNGVVLPAKPTTPATTPPATTPKQEPPRGTPPPKQETAQAATNTEIGPLKAKLLEFKAQLTPEQLKLVQAYRIEKHPALQKSTKDWTPADYVRAVALTSEWIEAHTAPTALKVPKGATLSAEQSAQLLCDLAGKLDKGYVHLSTTFGIKHPKDLGGIEIEGSDVEPREAEARYDYLYYLSQQPFELEVLGKQLGYAPEHIQALFASVQP